MRGGREDGGEDGRWETPVSAQALLPCLPQLVEGQCHISLSRAEVQDTLEKLNVHQADLPGLRLYVAAAIIESPGEQLRPMTTPAPASDL